jgi:uncharacterized protein YndB with AHSA1/START domain
MNAPALTAPASCDVTVTRVFDAPRALVFRTWTEPRHLARWWGPEHFTNPVCELDVRIGGRIVVHTRAPDGRMFLMNGTFREVVSAERLVMAVTATDSAGDPLLEGRITAMFEDEDGKTKVTVREEATALAPAAARIVDRMELNWIESLARLAGVVPPAA